MAFLASLSQPLIFLRTFSASAPSLYVSSHSLEHFSSSCLPKEIIWAGLRTVMSTSCVDTGLVLASPVVSETSPPLRLFTVALPSWDPNWLDCLTTESSPPK